MYSSEKNFSSEVYTSEFANPNSQQHEDLRDKNLLQDILTSPLYNLKSQQQEPLRDQNSIQQLQQQKNNNTFESGNLDQQQREYIQNPQNNFKQNFPQRKKNYEQIPPPPQGNDIPSANKNERLFTDSGCRRNIYIIKNQTTKITNDSQVSTAKKNCHKNIMEQCNKDIACQLDDQKLEQLVACLRLRREHITSQPAIDQKVEQLVAYLRRSQIASIREIIGHITSQPTIDDQMLEQVVDYLEIRKKKQMIEHIKSQPTFDDQKLEQLVYYLRQRTGQITSFKMIRKHWIQSKEEYERNALFRLLCFQYSHSSKARLNIIKGKYSFYFHCLNKMKQQKKENERNTLYHLLCFQYLHSSKARLNIIKGKCQNKQFYFHCLNKMKQFIIDPITYRKND